MKFKKVAFCLLAALLVISATACTSAPTLPSTEPTKAAVSSTPAVSESQSQSQTAAETKKKTFAVVFPIVHPFFEPVGVDAENFGKENGWEVITKAPDTANAQLQVEMMENLIAMKVDGIAIGPTDPTALVSVIDKAIDQGIKVICFETDAPKAKAHSYIGTDNYKAGRHMGAVIGKMLGGKGDIMILTGLPTQMSLNERIRGIQESLKEKFPDIKIVDTQSSEGDAQKAVSKTEDMILAHPDFKAIIGIDATAGPAAVSVWKAKGWQNSNEHMIITFDDMPDNLSGLKDGYIKSLVAQRQSSWGKSVIQMLNDLTEGKTIPDYTDTGSIEITLSNIDTYTGEPSYVEGQ
jgi:ribose transport system substrate-binding protein